METYQLLQARRTLTDCGFLHSDRGGLYVPLIRRFLQPMVLNPNDTFVWTREITGDTIWCLRSISSDQGMSNYQGVRIQIQMPNGRFLIGGNGQDVGQFAWVGSYRDSHQEEMDIEPGGKIFVTLTDVNPGGLAAPLPVNLVFEGFYKDYFQGTAGKDDGLASLTPRYQGIVNENILAPSWMAGRGPSTPVGSTDDYFVYSMENPAVVQLAGPLSTTANIPIDRGIEFICRRLLFDIEPGAAVTAGSFLVRLRTGDGYALMDDYIDAARYLGGAPYPVDWRIRGGDSVTVDLALVDSAGAGSISIQVHLEGMKRKRWA